MPSASSKLLVFTLRFIALVQVLLGTAFLFAPESSSRVLDLPVAPAWVNWMFGMMAARFLGFGYGMWVAARNPAAMRSWIAAMIAIQAIDWLVTVKYLAAGSVTLAQVTTAAFLPLLFVAVLLTRFPLPVTTGSRA